MAEAKKRKRRKPKPLVHHRLVKLPKSVEIPKELIAELEAYSNRQQMREGEAIVALAAHALFEMARARKKRRGQNEDDDED